MRGYKAAQLGAFVAQRVWFQACLNCCALVCKLSYHPVKKTRYTSKMLAMIAMS